MKLDYAADDFAALDRFGRVLDQIWTDYGAEPDVVLDHYSYEYDRAGSRTARENVLNDDFSESYEYDALDRLTSTTREDDFDQSWGLDGLGNFSQFDDDGDTQTRTANAANEITGITGGWISPSYDAAGNMISGPKPGDEDTRIHYVYDAWNRLVEVRADDSGEPGDLIAEYEYDGANRRVEKTVTEEGGGPAHGHYFYNQEWRLLEERFVDEEDELLASNQYVWSARYIDAPLVRFHDGNGDGDYLDAADNIRYYTGDANYNVTATLDAATGEVVERYVYTAYGTATVYSPTWTNPAAPTTDGPLYCGYFFDAETTLYHVRSRYYDSRLSAFISRDPMSYRGGMNLYEYVGDSPLVRTDPLGLADYTYWGVSIGGTVYPGVGGGLKVEYKTKLVPCCVNGVLSTKTVYDGRIHGEVGLGLGLDVEILTAKLSLQVTVATVNVDVGLRGETPCGGGPTCVRYCTDIGVNVPPVILPINSLDIGFIIGANVTATASGSFRICYSFPGCPSPGLAVGFCGEVAGDVSVSYLFGKIGAHADIMSGCVALYGTRSMLEF